MLTLILALTVLLVHLFPISCMVYDIFGINVGSGFAQGGQRYTEIAVNYVPAIFISWVALRSLNVKQFIHQLSLGLIIIRFGLIVYAIYLILALGGILLSSIPYGGGHVPRILGLLVVLVKACLFSGLFIAICKELPAAQGRK